MCDVRKSINVMTFTLAVSEEVYDLDRNYILIMMMTQK